MKIKEVLSALERFAPLPLQESWDNAGLQVGLTETEVSGALLCLDVNERIVDEAIRKGCNLIVSHHPLLFRGLKTISDLTDVQRTVMKAIEYEYGQRKGWGELPYCPETGAERCAVFRF